MYMSPPISTNVASMEDLNTRVGVVCLLRLLMLLQKFFPRFLVNSLHSQVCSLIHSCAHSFIPDHVLIINIETDRQYSQPVYHVEMITTLTVLCCSF